MFYTLLFLLAHFTMEFNNYVEIDIKLENPDLIQLFMVTKDSIPKWTEKQSKWKEIKKAGKYQLVRWDIPADLVYERFRIDLSTFNNHEIEIRRIKIHVNGKNIVLYGQSIFNWFAPNPYVKVIQCHNDFILLKSVGISNKASPSIEFLNNHIIIDTVFNSKLEIQINSRNQSVLSVSIEDEGGIIKGRAHCVTPGDNEIIIPFNLESKPIRLSIKPSIAQNNVIEIKRIKLKYKKNYTEWIGEEVVRSFHLSLFQPADLLTNKLITRNSRFATSQLTIENFEFAQEKMIRIFILSLSLIFSAFILHRLNIYWVKEGTING